MRDSSARQHVQYQTRGGVQVRRAVAEMPYGGTMADLAAALDSQRGVLLASGFEYPGRYTRWDIGFVNPPLCITARGSRVTVSALNTRGEILLPEIIYCLQPLAEVAEIAESTEAETVSAISVNIKQADSKLPVEQQCRQPNVFSVLRCIIQHFYAEEDAYLGLYGAFGYDLALQLENVQRHQQRDESQRDLVLYLPDQITVADHRIQQARRYDYEFIARDSKGRPRSETTGGYRRSGAKTDYAAGAKSKTPTNDSAPDFAKQTQAARQAIQQGELLQVVPSQVFAEPCKNSPAQVFARLQHLSPAPYGALMNLGEQEYLVAASPAMFLRVEGRRIESCPVAGSMARGGDAIADAEQIRRLLNSAKDEAELTMCSDVDRDDKARVCEPGSVQIIGRRQVELSARLIHTADHVQGLLRDGCDAVDGFLAHVWAATVTGAPKHAAMQFIEQHETSPRAWYGGALGCMNFNGNLNTGLTLRTIHIHQGVAKIRIGATVVATVAATVVATTAGIVAASAEDAVGNAIAQSTENAGSNSNAGNTEQQAIYLKASALLEAVRGTAHEGAAATNHSPSTTTTLRALLIDHNDSSAHSLAAYFQQQGAQVTVMPAPLARKTLAALDASNNTDSTFDLIILSSGPASPAHHNMQQTIDLALAHNIPLFAVGLGMQAIVEYFGGKLASLAHPPAHPLSQPMPGKPATIRHQSSPLFAGIPESFTAACYHSRTIHSLPKCLEATAHSTTDGDTDADATIMAVAHRTLPITAVHFHPQSLTTLPHNTGPKLIANVVTAATKNMVKSSP